MLGRLVEKQLRKGKATFYCYSRPLRFSLSAIIVICSNLLIAQTPHWVSLPQELNGHANVLSTYGDDLVAGGMFSLAGVTPANNIALWNGSNWESLDGGMTAEPIGFVTELLVFEDNLYAAGNFTSAGGTSANNIAVWTGSEWSALGSGTNGTISSMAVFDNQLYIGGIFTEAGGVNVNHIARWDGAEWHALDSGILGNNVNDMVVYQNELYALGPFSEAGGVACNNIARWTGSEWLNAAGGLEFGYTTLIEWDGKLLAGTELDWATEVIFLRVSQWDGVSWSSFSEQQMMPWIRKFAIFDNKLYGAGGTTTGPSEASYVVEWTGSEWVTVGEGINDYTPALCVHNGELYCGGHFNMSDGSPHNFIARWTDEVGIMETNSHQSFSIFPNPGSGQMTLGFGLSEPDKGTTVDVLDMQGKAVHSSTWPNGQSRLQLDLSHLRKGLYLVRVNAGAAGYSEKVVLH